jgi:hypothetical protein
MEMIEVGGSSEAWEQFYEKPTSGIIGLTCASALHSTAIFVANYAGIGYTYDADELMCLLHPPAPFNSWTLDENHDWQPPTPKPIDDKLYAWFEPNQQWIELIEP